MAGPQGLAIAEVICSSVFSGVPRSSANDVRAMEMAVEYARDRKQFGRPIGAYQAVSHRCAQMLLETEGARSATYYGAWTADAQPEQLELAASMAKAYASDAAALRDAQDAYGVSNLEPSMWAAVILAGAGRSAEADALVARLASLHPGCFVLFERLTEPGRLLEVTNQPADEKLRTRIQDKLGKQRANLDQVEQAGHAKIGLVLNH